jgi:hypothetical protein
VNALQPLLSIPALSVLEPLVDRLQRFNQQPQNPLTIRASINTEQEARLREVLKRISENVVRNESLPLGLFKDTLHFARLLIVPGADHPEHYGSSLVLMANVDGSVQDFLSELVMKAGRGLDDIFSDCEGYPEAERRNYATRLVFLTEKLIPAQAYYINTIGRGVRQIVQEDQLRQAIQQFLQQVDVQTLVSATALRREIIAYVKKNPQLLWALTPAVQPSFWWKAKEQLRLVVLVFLGALVVTWFWPLLLAWLVVLQSKEAKDHEERRRPPLLRLTQLRAPEDVYAHNQFSAVGYLKPGWVRKTTVKVALSVVHASLRHVFNRGNLAGVPWLGLEGVDTIHFARWVLIDDDRRLLFASNYDGSLESYMVDFVDKVAWGLNLVFSNGAGYPKTRWLVLDGARNEQKFKDFLGNHQLDTEVWYTPYGHLTAVNIANNAAIRAGLLGDMNERDAQRWLARL